jgi:hypothetical protein
MCALVGTRVIMRRDYSARVEEMIASWTLILTRSTHYRVGHRVHPRADVDSLLASLERA